MSKKIILFASICYISLIFSGGSIRVENADSKKDVFASYYKELNILREVEYDDNDIKGLRKVFSKALAKLDDHSSTQSIVGYEDATLSTDARRFFILSGIIFEKTNMPFETLVPSNQLLTSQPDLYKQAYVLYTAGYELQKSLEGYTYDEAAAASVVDNHIKSLSDSPLKSELSKFGAKGIQKILTESFQSHYITASKNPTLSNQWIVKYVKSLMDNQHLSPSKLSNKFVIHKDDMGRPSFAIKPYNAYSNNEIFYYNLSQLLKMKDAIRAIVGFGSDTTPYIAERFVPLDAPAKNPTLKFIEQSGTLPIYNLRFLVDDVPSGLDPITANATKAMMIQHLNTTNVEGLDAILLFSFLINQPLQAKKLVIEQTADGDQRFVSLGFEGADTVSAEEFPRWLGKIPGFERMKISNALVAKLNDVNQTDIEKLAAKYNSTADVSDIVWRLKALKENLFAKTQERSLPLLTAAMWGQKRIPIADFTTEVAVYKPRPDLSLAEDMYHNLQSFMPKSNDLESNKLLTQVVQAILTNKVRYDEATAFLKVNHNDYEKAVTPEYNKFRHVERLMEWAQGRKELTKVILGNGPYDNPLAKIRQLENLYTQNVQAWLKDI